MNKKSKKTESHLDRAERILAESAVRSAKWETEMEAERKKAAANHEKWAAEMEAERKKAAANHEKWAAEMRAVIANTNKQIGDYTQGDGEMLEQEYIAAMAKEKRIGDIVIEEVLPNPGGEFEYDAALPNGEVVVVAEIKRRFTLGDLRKFVKNRLPRFAAVCPWIAGDRKIIGAIGGGVSPRVVEEAEKFGVIVMGLKNRKLVIKSQKHARPI